MLVFCVGFAVPSAYFFLLSFDVALGTVKERCCCSLSPQLQLVDKQYDGIRTGCGNPPPSSPFRSFVFNPRPRGLSPVSLSPGDEMFYTPQHAREGTPQHGKNGGSGFSFPPGGGAGEGAGSGGSVYVTPRSTPRYIGGGASTDGGVDRRRGAYAHQVGHLGRGFESFLCVGQMCLVFLFMASSPLFGSVLLRQTDVFLFVASSLLVLS